MHKQLIKLAKRFKYFDYIFTLDIFMQCISMIKLAWDNPDVALCQDITAPNNMYKESVEGLSNIKKFFDKYLEAGSRCDYVEAKINWNILWKEVCDVLEYLWD